MGETSFPHGPPSSCARGGASHCCAEQAPLRDASVLSGDGENGRPSVSLLYVYAGGVSIRADKCEADELLGARSAVLEKVRACFDSPCVARSIEDLAQRDVERDLKLGLRLLIEWRLCGHPVPPPVIESHRGVSF